MNELPVIDATGLAAREPGALARLSAEIGHACRETGFFYVTGHGLAPDYLESVMAASRHFFSLPMPEKDALKISAGSDNRG